MKAAAVLMAAEAAGVHIKIDNGDLVLEAAAPPPDSIVDALSAQKAGIIALLETQNGGSINETSIALFPTTRSTQFHQIRPNYGASGVDPYDSAINTWLNNNPAASPPDRCAWCFGAEYPDHAVVPFGVYESGHIWLHGECWDAWQQHRRQMAAIALGNKNGHCPTALAPIDELLGPKP